MKRRAIFEELTLIFLFLQLLSSGARALINTRKLESSSMLDGWDDKNFTVAFIVPVHTKKFKFLLNFIRSFENFRIEADLYCVFSSLEEKNAFDSANFGRRGNIKLTKFDGDKMMLDVHPIFFKKFWQAAQLNDKYEYAYVLDSDSEVIKHFNALQFAVDLYKRKVVYGSRSIGTELEVRGSMWRFSEDAKANLMNSTRNGAIDIWWTEIPVLHMPTAKKFISDLHVLSSPPISMRYEFDFMAYSYYLLVNAGWKLVDVSDKLPKGFCQKGSFIECGGGNAEIMKLVNPHWMAKKHYDESRKRFDGLDIFILFHVDRK